MLLLMLILILFFLYVETIDALAVLPSDSAPSWRELRKRLVATPEGQRLDREEKERELGEGPPHTDASLRLFGSKKDHVRVKFYRDSAAWCNYCQKVWLTLEELEVPYTVQKVPLNAYGDKPAWFTRLVDGGKLPAIQLDGNLYTESLQIMELLHATFSREEHSISPSDDKYKALIELEQDLQRAWFSLVFYPVQDEALVASRLYFEKALQRVDDALGETPGPWFLGGDSPSVIDMHFIPTMERLLSSTLYYKGIQIKGKYRHLDLWLSRWDERPSYQASKSDDYTLAKAMPSQNGPGYMIPEAREYADHICGLNGAWSLPLVTTKGRHEAAYCLIKNPSNIVQFACRGAGEPGRPAFHAELADPYAEPNEDFFDAVDTCLRHVTVALIEGTDNAMAAAKLDLAGSKGTGELRANWGAYEDENGSTYYWNEETGDTTWTPPALQLDTCLTYLRDRVGVPRDMSSDAAMQLRAHLNWVMELMS